ncbi:MAG: hypothetical protein ABH834_06845 [Candidatus Altiarchaeota archaeon]
MTDEEPSPNPEGGVGDMASRALYAVLGLTLILLSAAAVYLLYIGYYLEVVAVMLPSWLFYILINDVPEDRKTLTKILRPLNILFTLLACSTLIAVIIAGLYLLFMLLVFLGRTFVGIMSYSPPT